MKIKYLQMYKALFVPSLGKELKRTVSDEPQSHPGVKMYYMPTGAIHCTLGSIEFIVPSSMVECVVLEPSNVE